MAARGKSLRTHDGGSLRARQRRQFLDGLFELGREHVIGVAVERLHAPGAVGRVRQPPTTAASQSRKVDVVNARFGQGFTQLFLTKLRMPSRAGKAADVGQALDRLRRKQLEERFDLVSRMTEGPDRRRGFYRH